MCIFLNPNKSASTVSSTFIFFAQPITILITRLYHVDTKTSSEPQILETPTIPSLSPCLAKVFILYHCKTRESHMLFGIFRRYKTETLTRNGLVKKNLFTRTSTVLVNIYVHIRLSRGQLVSSLVMVPNEAPIAFL